MKASADNILKVAEMTKIVLDRLKNIVGQGENVGYQNVFKSLTVHGHQKSGLCGRVNKKTFKNVVEREKNLENSNFCYTTNWKGFQFRQLDYLSLSKTSPGFYMSAVLVFWKHCGKRRNCS